MGEFLQGFLDNDSFFGKFMTKCGIIICANLLFVLCCLPCVTIGAGLVATYHVMFRTLREKEAINPFREFWSGFRRNFRQATIAFLGFAALVAVAFLDLAFCRARGGMWGLFSYGIYALLLVLLILAIYLLPVMAAFEDSLPHLLRNAFFFALQKPWKLFVILFFSLAPMILTYTDLQMLPLYAFLWCFFGFGAVAMLVSTLLLPEFAPYLALHPKGKAEGYGNGGEYEDVHARTELDAMPDAEVPSYDGGAENEAAMLEDLRRLDGI